MYRFLLAFLLFPSIVFAQAIKQGTTSSAGDAGDNIPLCKATAASGTINTEGKYGFCSVDLNGNLRTTTSLSYSGSTTDPSKLEDGVHASGDRGDFILGVRNSAGTGLTNTDGDYSPVAVNQFGGVKCELSTDFTDNSGKNPYRLEDAAFTGGSAVMVVGAVREDTISASAADADVINIKTDSAGRTYTNPWGANHTEWFRACSGSDVTGTTATEVVPATASKYNYLTSVNCTNTDATVNTRVNIVQETAVGTEILWSLNLAAITGSDGMTFGTPLKATAVNKNIGVTPITTSAEVRCCMTGFVSAN